MSSDNWTRLLEEYIPLYGRIFVDERTDVEYRFFGLVDAEDDYYYGMYSGETGNLRLLSCVGHIEAHGFILQDLPEGSE